MGRPKKVHPEPTEPTVEAAPEPKQSEPVAILGLGDDFVSRVPEVNQPAVAAAELQQFSKETLEEAENENNVRTFMASLSVANKPEVKVYTPPPVPKAIAETTRLEMEAGRKRVAEFEALEAARPRPAPVQEGKNTAVFRPADFVPDPRKGEGLVASNSIRTL